MSRAQQPDFYAVLGVDPRASTEEIKRAYRRLTLDSHPDRHPDDPALQERYRLINQAYATIGNPEARARYDASLTLSDALDLSKGFDGQVARDLLGNVFGDLFGARRRERRRGRDIRYTLTVDFEEAVLGSSHTIEFEAPAACDACGGSGTQPNGRPPDVCPNCSGRGEVKGEGLLARRTRCGRCDGTGMVQRDPCSGCRGRGSKRRQRAFTVRVPPGMEAGAERLLQGEGEPGRYGGEAGDLRVTVDVRPHPWLRRDDMQILCDVSVSVTEAALGAKVPVPTVDGLVTMDVPPGTRSGARLRLRHKGVPGAKTRGDQIVTVAIEPPTVSGRDDVEALLRDLEAVCVREPDLLPRRAEQRRQRLGSGRPRHDDAAE